MNRNIYINTCIPWKKSEQNIVEWTHCKSKNKCKHNIKPLCETKVGQVNDSSSLLPSKLRKLKSLNHSENEVPGWMSDRLRSWIHFGSFRTKQCVFSFSSNSWQWAMQVMLYMQLSPLTTDWLASTDSLYALGFVLSLKKNLFIFSVAGAMVHLKRPPMEGTISSIVLDWIQSSINCINKRRKIGHLYYTDPTYCDDNICMLHKLVVFLNWL